MYNGSGFPSIKDAYNDEHVQSCTWTIANKIIPCEFLGNVMKRMHQKKPTNATKDEQLNKDEYVPVEIYLDCSCF